MMMFFHFSFKAGLTFFSLNPDNKTMLLQSC